VAIFYYPWYGTPPHDGAWLHWNQNGHVPPTDVYSRFQRMTGRNVLHAMGYDAFGLPAEQYAVQTGTHPRVTTEANIATMKRQMRALGLGPHDAVLAPAWHHGAEIEALNRSGLEVSFYEPGDTDQVVAALRSLGELTVGIGAAQASRQVSVEIALRRAGDRSKLAVMASDAYFPFPDGIQIAAQGGVTAIIQPGGSIRDEMAIEVADRHHMAMVFTGRRHFRH